MLNVIKYKSLDKYSNWLLLTLLVSVLSLAMACGSSDSDSDSNGAGDAAAPAAEEVEEALAEVSRILSPSSSLTFDDYVAAG